MLRHLFFLWRQLHIIPEGDFQIIVIADGDGHFLTLKIHKYCLFKSRFWIFLFHISRPRAKLGYVAAIGDFIFGHFALGALPNLISDFFASENAEQPPRAESHKTAVLFGNGLSAEKRVNKGMKDLPFSGERRVGIAVERQYVKHHAVNHVNVLLIGLYKGGFAVSYCYENIAVDGIFIGS